MKKSLRALGALVGALALATISFAPANAEEALADDTASVEAVESEETVVSDDTVVEEQVVASSEATTCPPAEEVANSASAEEVTNPVVQPQAISQPEVNETA